MSSEILNEDAQLQLFEICLHREEYFPGEMVTGKILLLTSRPLKTEGVYLKFEGKGSVRWKKRNAYLCGFQEAEFVHEKRKYFSNVFRYDLDYIPEGCSVLTFDFELPTGIPQSIEAGTVMRQLKIMYYVEALIIISPEEYKQQKGFVLKSILNLNAYPELSFPICKTISEPVFESCWSSSAKVVVMSFSIKKQGFVAGEKIKAELIIKDSYSNEPPGLEVYLIQEIDLQTSIASRVRRRIIVKSDVVRVTHFVSETKSKYGDRNAKTDNQQKFNFLLAIPDDILISYENTDKQVNDFISIRYYLRMSMEQTSFPYKPLQMHLPIKIGTVFVKEQKLSTPILLLAPVPQSLPRPKISLEAGNKYGDASKQYADSSANQLPPPPTKTNINSVPKIILNSRNSLALSEHPTSSSCNASPKTPKRKLGNMSLVGDSSGSLNKPVKAFGGDSDSDSFRSGVEDLHK